MSKKPRQNDPRDEMIDEKSFSCPFFCHSFFVSMGSFVFLFWARTIQIRSKLSFTGYSIANMIQLAEIVEIH